MHISRILRDTGRYGVLRAAARTLGRKGSGRTGAGTALMSGKTSVLALDEGSKPIHALMCWVMWEPQPMSDRLASHQFFGGGPAIWWPQ